MFFIPHSEIRNPQSKTQRTKEVGKMKKINAALFTATFLVFTLLILSLGHSTFADEMINETNWEKAQDLVPEEMLEMIKKGDFSLNTVDKVNFSTNRETGFWVSHAKQAFKTNVGKYDLNEKQLIIDVSTGEHAKFIIGFPFPKIDPNDPKAAAKVMYNKEYLVYQLGGKHSSSIFQWIGRKGFEREVAGVFRETYPIGWPGAEKIPNPDGIERFNIISVERPFDIAGTSVMLWRYLDERRDMNYSYVPAIRRVRRMSPASRSDGFLGSDLCVDDIITYDGKIADFEWRLVGKQNGFLPWHSTEPLRAVKNEKGEVRVLDKEIIPVRYGYQEKDWSGAPWCPLSVVYAKRPVWVVEAKPKDPYYNYGTQYIWVDEEANLPFLKVVYDRGGKFWKMILLVFVAYQTDDKQVQFFGAGDHIVMDVKTDHATIAKSINPNREMSFFKELDVNDFTLGGFQKYCK